MSKAIMQILNCNVLCLNKKMLITIALPNAQVSTIIKKLSVAIRESYMSLETSVPVFIKVPLKNENFNVRKIAIAAISSQMVCTRCIINIYLSELRV